MKNLKIVEFRLQLVFGVMLIILSVVSLVLGRKLAVFITKPLNNLVDATIKLRSGDFSYKLPEIQGRDETAVLTRAFNMMTQTLSDQRTALIKSNSLVDERRRFIEAILGGISTGVITVNSKHEVLLINQSAKILLRINSEHTGGQVSEIFPEITELLDTTSSLEHEITHRQIKIVRGDAAIFILVRIGVFWDESNKIKTFMITVDDVTELLSAQRSAAWADVARRIAHEIKNPLTPIILSAERIRSKYKQYISTDLDNFDKYIDTIIKHVTNIGEMVEEFVRFARIPLPKFRRSSIVNLIREAVFSLKMVSPNISWEVNDNLQDKQFVNCDAAQITQVVINLLKNSIESIEQRFGPKDGGKVSVVMNTRSDAFVEIKVIDNGVGISQDILEKIFDPYISTKPRGNGLGLAIVKKIIEDHGGTIALRSLDVGAEVKFTLPIFNENRTDHELK